MLAAQTDLAGVHHFATLTPIATCVSIEKEADVFALLLRVQNSFFYICRRLVGLLIAAAISLPAPFVFVLRDSWLLGRGGRWRVLSVF